MKKTAFDTVLNELRDLNTDSITPLEAINLIYEWKKRLSGETDSIDGNVKNYISRQTQKATQKPRNNDTIDSTLPLFE